MDTRPVRTQAAKVLSAANMVREFSPSIGAVFNARRALFHLGRAVLYVNSTGLELLADPARNYAAPRSIRMMMRLIGSPSSQRRIGMTNSS
jgi:hypothetical protein